MNSSDTPSRIVKAFGVSGLKNVIAVDSSSATDNSGVATFDKGFPPITMQPLSAGGIPPSGKDMNGVLYAVTLQQQWQNAGMTYPFSSDFASTVSGYPKGSIIPSSVYTGQWLNLNEANSNTPESPTGAQTGWVPINNYGVTNITGLSGSSVTMSSLQAAKDRIILSGVLTANINLIFPAWIKSWVVHNNCTGNFNVTCKTSSGSGVVVIPGLVSRLFCDGVNITDETYNPNNDMVGMVCPFAMNAAPTGWLFANGMAVSRITYARLFSRIGTLYGAGNGTTTFNLPDLRGEFVRGFDAGKGTDPGRVFGSLQTQSIQSHAHNIPAWKQPNPDPTGGGYAVGGDGGGGGSQQEDIVTRNSGGSETRPRNIAFVYCIKY
ncbi:phage tail protein [Lelliottia sp. V89_10]|uniref:phage tail protein n=1 Tax=Lelliottia wanjuensis TaxID=3050585 RepID=UPI00249DD9D0|nr:MULTISPECIES: phage tail protein [unclassified Lelliottia]MDI3361135.1 phage tail protein [Lelliottia sp. V89_13]MDK9551234.1 phage tail protein [Lelliottia sp. V89_5]MDK9597494.1 phage tail protein [Lelliottia sp. V89_10]